MVCLCMQVKALDNPGVFSIICLAGFVALQPFINSVKHSSVFSNCWLKDVVSVYPCLSLVFIHILA